MLPLLLMVPVLFVAGAVFAYFVIMPAALNFLLGFNADQFNIQIRGSEYYGFFVLTLISVGILFQIPVGTIAVTRLAIVTPEQLAVQPPLRRPGDRGAGDAAAGHRPGDDADLDGAAVRAVRALAGARAQVRAPTRHNRRMVGRLLGLAASRAACARSRRRAPGASVALRRRQPRGRHRPRTCASSSAAPGDRRSTRRSAARAASASTCCGSKISPADDVVVFDLGTNDDPAKPGALAATSPRRARSPATAAWWSRRSTARRSTASRSTGSTEAVTSFAAQRPNVALVDWHAAVAERNPGLLIDGVHPTPRATRCARGCSPTRSAPASSVRRGLAGRRVRGRSSTRPARCRRRLGGPQPAGPGSTTSQPTTGATRVAGRSVQALAAAVGARGRRPAPSSAERPRPRPLSAPQRRRCFFAIAFAFSIVGVASRPSESARRP